MSIAEVNVRADTYLWAIRMYRSRTLAATAIKGGKVKLEGETFKPSHLVRSGEKYALRIGSSEKIIEVISITDKRSSFEIAKLNYKDLTPAVEKQASDGLRTAGAGRPTKKDRRELDKWRD